MPSTTHTESPPGGTPDPALSFSERTMLVFALCAGALGAGLGALFFALMEQAGAWFQDRLLAHSPYWPLLICPFGLVLIVGLRDRYFTGTDGTGIPQTIAALKMGDAPAREAVLSPRVAFGKLILTTLALFSFFSIGREGPSVQLGACIMRLAGKCVRLPRHFAERGVILAGGAAGIAAAFNAPLAGIIFAFEEIGRSFDKRNLGLIVRTVLIACIVCIAAVGNSYFYGDLDAGRAPLAYTTLKAWLIVPLIGLGGGLLGGLFARGLIAAMPLAGALLRRHGIVAALVIGLLIAGIGLSSNGSTYGGGYQQARALLLEGSPAFTATLDSAEQASLATVREGIGPAYSILRAAASFLILMTGIPGGLFDPSFSVGAGLGEWLAPLLAWSGASPQSILLLCIVAYFTGVVQSPLTAMVILIEMTGVISFSLPLGLAAILAFEASRRVCPNSLYEALAENFLKH